MTRLLPVGNHPARRTAGISMMATQTALPPGSQSSRSAAAHSDRSAVGIEVTRIASLEEARALKAEWATLAETAGGQNPFTHPDWLLLWAEHFIRPHEEIWLLAARRGGRLAGVAPFYRRAWGPGLAHSMQLWGTSRDYRLIELPQILVDRDQPRAVARALLAGLSAYSDRWDWAEVALQDSLWLEPDWLPRSGEIAILTKAVRAGVVLPLGKDRPPAMKRNVRESLRRARNRLNRSFPGAWTVDCALSATGLLAALPDLTRLHDERSRLRGKKRHPSVLERPEHEAYLTAGVLAAAARGGAAIYRLLVNGQAAAALLVLRSSECTYFLISGIDPRFWEFSPVTLLQGRAIDDAATLGHHWANLSTGPDTPKLRWSEELTVSTEFALVAGRGLARARFALFWLASQAGTVLRETRRHQVLGTPVSGADAEVLPSGRLAHYAGMSDGHAPTRRRGGR